MARPISSHVKDKNSIFTARDEYDFLVKGKILARAIVDFCWSMVILILRQLIFAIVKRWFFVAWTLVLAFVQLEFQHYGIFILNRTQSCVKIRVHESKCRAVKRVNRAENREKPKIRTRNTPQAGQFKVFYSLISKVNRKDNTVVIVSTRCDFTDLALFTRPRSRHWKKSPPRMKQSPCK